MPLTRPHVLVIDGAPEVLDLFRDLLEAEGYRVSLCVTATASVDFVKRIAPDIIVLDIVLSDRDAGQQLLWDLRKDLETARITVLVCTSTVRLPEEAHERLAEEGVAVIQKPFDIDVLLETIAGCLRGPRSRQLPVTENGHVAATVFSVE